MGLDSGKQGCEEILFLEPQIMERVWGGDRLLTEFPYHADFCNAGECWAVSAYKGGQSRVKNGKYAGMTLDEVYAGHRELFGGIAEEEFPLLVKIIDAKEDLSIQVHPDDAYARKQDAGLYGKTECWYVMDCPEDASLVIGHHAKTRQELQEMIEEGRYDDLIQEVPVRKGDFLQITPGTVHAIKGGFLILETQQSSDITYRVYDYGRLVDNKPRELHIKQSIDVIAVPGSPADQCVTSARDLPANRMNLLIECSLYKVWKLTVEGCAQMEQSYPFMIASVLEGSGTIDGQAVAKGSHFILPCGYGNATLCGNMELILSTV